MLDDDHYDDDGDISSEEEFRYPSATPESTRPASRASDYFNRPGVSRGPTDLTPQLSQAPEFRVPTREAPQKVITPHWTPPTPHQLTAQWERDDQVPHCRDCQRRFSFLLRRVCTFLLSIFQRPKLIVLYLILARKCIFLSAITDH